ncbi:MAG: L-threonylcarbamoyladenylate synthase [Lachnospiraceae bacterium]|nr:L-threonylcarbamoyladenylate synthase [Lachnospiraceae bacterium]
MQTKIVKINRENFTDIQLNEAGEIIRDGGLVAFPTETVYGLGGNAFDPEAASKIYAAKGRPSDNPLIVHIADMDGLSEIVENVPESAAKLAAAFWPGPMTLVMRKKPVVPDRTTGGLDTVAVRMPVDEIARALIRVSGVPIAAPSANRSGRPSTTTAQHCIEDLDGRIEMIIDGGSVDIGLESTIVDVTGDIPMLLRPGAITLEMLRDVLGRVDIDPAILGPMAEGVRPKAPGMKYKHYAPKAELTIVMGEPDKVRDKINELVAADIAAGRKSGVIATLESRNAYHGQTTLKVMGTRNDESTVARNLFAILREFDETGVDRIYSEGFEDTGIGRAIMNRLRKAAGYSILEVD